ncbi:MAG: LysM peptidoglycan-binding domain-containing protein, partial [Chitinophagaceae bacterium]
MKSFFCLLLGMGLVLVSAAQERMTAAQYIAGFKNIAMSEMRRTGIPASIKLAQGLLEAEMGNSNLVKRSNNHFGIKCKTEWTGESVSHDDDEKGECFRKYNNPEDSYRDHSDFLRSRDRYASLFNLRPDDYKGWAYGLKKAGYATNPRYPQMLIYNIEKYNLQQYDEIVINSPQPTPEEENLATDEPVNEPETTLLTGGVNEVASAADYKVKTRRNGLSAVFAAKGTSLLAIATVHQVALTRLLEYNDLKKDGLLQEDAWIYLERKNKESSQSTHTAIKGETLFDISQSHGVQLSRLVDYNNMPPEEPLTAGTVVHLKAVPMDIASNGSARTGKFLHEVAPKEGLY